MKKLLMLTIATVTLANAAFDLLSIPEAAKPASNGQQVQQQPSIAEIVKEYVKKHGADATKLNPLERAEKLAETQKLFKNADYNAAVAFQNLRGNTSFKTLQGSVFQSIQTIVEVPVSVEVIQDALRSALSVYAKGKNKTAKYLNHLILREFIKLSGLKLTRAQRVALSKENLSVFALSVLSFKFLSSEQQATLEGLLENVQSSKGKALKEAQTALTNFIRKHVTEAAKSMPGHIVTTEKALESEKKTLEQLEKDLKALEGQKTKTALSESERLTKEIESEKKKIAFLEETLKEQKAFVESANHLEIVLPLLVQKDTLASLSGLSVATKAEDEMKYLTLQYVIETQGNVKKIEKSQAELGKWLEDIQDTPADRMDVIMRELINCGVNFEDSDSQDVTDQLAPYSLATTLNELDELVTDKTNFDTRVSDDEHVYGILAKLSAFDEQEVKSLTHQQRHGLDLLFENMTNHAFRDAVHPLLNVNNLEEILNPRVKKEKANSLYETSKARVELENNVLSAYYLVK